MHTRSTTIIAAGVAVAVLGAVLVFAYARNVEGQSAPGPNVAAFVATADITPGTPWEDVQGQVEQRQVPEDLRPASAITDPEQLNGRRSVRHVSSGEVVTAAQFGLGEAAPAAGLEIPPGRNAVTVNVGAPQGVARYVQPGDFVNVYVSFKSGAEGDLPWVTKLVLSNIQVLANQLQTSTDKDKAGPAAGGEVLLTLAMTPDEAEKLIFSKENGSIWFGLVHPGDGPVTTGGRTPADVLN